MTRFLLRIALLLALAPVARAEAQDRTIGSYSFGGGALRVDTHGRRVALFAQDRDGSRVTVLVDPSSVSQWLGEAGALVKAGAAPEDQETTPLTHRDESMGGSVVLTRPGRGAGGSARLYLTVTGDSDHIAMIPLTPMDARIVIAALDRAAAEARGR
jgi:hypothetical protein